MKKSIVSLSVKLICLIALCLGTLACSNQNQDYEKVYESLKEGESKILVSIDNEDFYRKESIFKGEVTVTNNFLHLNFFDQFESNVILVLGGDNWFMYKPVKKIVTVENSMNASVMIGKIIDKAQHKGRGYLMTDGTIEVKTLTQDKIIIELNGKVGRYMGERDPSKWNSLKSVIICKKPQIKLQGVTPEKVYYE